MTTDDDRSTVAKAVGCPFRTLFPRLSLYGQWPFLVIIGGESREEATDSAGHIWEERRGLAGKEEGNEEELL